MTPLVRIRLTHVIAVFFMVAVLLPVTERAVPAADFIGTIRIGGTGGAYGTITQVAAGYQKIHPHVRFVFPPSLGSTGGIKAVIAGALDVGMSSRPPTEAEIHQGAVPLEYGRTPFLLVTSHKKPGINFTLGQIASVYAGDLKTYPDGSPIRVIMRPETETDMRLIRSLSPKLDKAVQKAQAREGMIIAITDQDNLKVLEKTKGALGWMTLAQLVSQKSSLKPLSINNIMPNRVNFASGRYPYYKSFFVITGTKPTPLVKSFIEFLTSDEGRAILLKNGHVVDVKKP
jgi:phosphate transport system substrate-binding protein